MNSETCDSAQPERFRIGVLIPALDEEEALPLVLAELPRELVDRLCVVDNGSRDRTPEVARAGGAEVVYEPRRGYGQACLAGIHQLLSGPAALGPDDVLVFLDADHSDYPADLPDVIAPIRDGQADFVVGSRILGGADLEALLPQAWFGNRLACFLMYVLFGARHTDLGPFRAIRVQALQALEMRDTDFGWTVEMQLKARTQKLRVVEVPVRYRKRIGKSKITGTISGTFRAGFKILGWILTWRLRLWLGPRRGNPKFHARPRTGPR